MLDRRLEGRRLAIVVEGEAKAIERLAYEGVEHRVVDLNLDETFEAYVAGKTQEEDHMSMAAVLDPPAIVESRLLSVSSI